MLFQNILLQLMGIDKFVLSMRLTMEITVVRQSGGTDELLSQLSWQNGALDPRPAVRATIFRATRARVRDATTYADFHPPEPDHRGIRPCFAQVGSCT